MVVNVQQVSARMEQESLMETERQIVARLERVWRKYNPERQLGPKNLYQTHRTDMNDQPDYYRLPDHGHDKTKEAPAWAQYTLLGVSVAISALSAYLVRIL
jgi:hypothetical protein